MPGLKSLYHHIIWLLKGVQVFGLVGKAGTGKSFRAQLVADRYGIQMIIDDGLLIKSQKILAGKSAKQEKGAYSAVKAALFDNQEHTEEVRKALEREDFKRLLILGTSNRMIHRIARRLDLPSPTKLLNIEDIATTEEIEKARHSRQRDGGHIIPVPAIEVKSKHSHIFLNSIRILFRRGFRILNKHDVYEKSVVKPPFSSKGKVTISEEALTQMVLHCVSDFDQALRVKKVIITTKGLQYGIEVFLNVPFKTQLSGSLHNLQNFILINIEKFTGISLSHVDVTIDSISE
jgi:uncharacterized alkaline shock family protein YloU